MARPRPPSLYRLSRIFQRITIVVVVIIVAYLAFCGISVFKLSASNVSGFNTIQPTLGNQSAGVSGDLAIANPGYAPVNSLNFKGVVQLENGTVLTSLGLPSLTLGPSDTGRVPFNLTIGLQRGDAGSILLFQSNTLRLLFALNVSYAYLFTVKVLATGSVTWGAPFANLTFVPSGPLVEESNGSAELPLTTSFVNHARFLVAGTFQIQVLSSSDQVCGTSTLLVDAPGGQDYHFVGNTTVSGSSACLSDASTVMLVYEATSHILISFPPEVLG